MFKLDSVGGKARSGRLKTSHGWLETPLFMPVATKGAVKHVSNEELEAIGTQCMIANGFLFSLKPGLHVVKKAGGIHKFIGWKRGLFTDSGGFQILNKEFLLRIDDKGVLFRNPFDGSKEFLSPEKAIQIQNALKSDVAMCLDDVPLFGSNSRRLVESAERTTLWAKRCKEAHRNRKQLLFGISQGGTLKRLREKSARGITEIGFDGLALGGLCIGEGRQRMLRMIKINNNIFPEEKPRYLMGVGSAIDLLDCIALGIDVFDSCFPARTARHGLAFCRNGNLNIEKKIFASDFRQLDKGCDCFVCKNHSRALVHHLFRTREENGLKYLTIHNIAFVQRLVAEARQAIKENSFERYRKRWRRLVAGKGF